MRSGAGSSSGRCIGCAIKVRLTGLFIPTSRTTMRNMSLLELLFALLLVCVLLAVGVVAALVWSLVRRADSQVRDVAELRSRLEPGGVTQESQAAALRERLPQTQSVAGGLRPAVPRAHP